MKIVRPTTYGDWTIETSAAFPFGLRFAVATTMGHTTRFSPKWCPDAKSLAHEFTHVQRTHWLKYLVSWSIGRLWGSTYWKDEEIAANAAENATPLPNWITDLAAQVRAAYPPDVPTGTISHPV